jgi:hypothetical protein
VRALFTLDGVRGLERALERGGEALKSRVGVACEQTARNVQQAAQRFAPRDRGDLIRAIKVAGKGLNWRVGVEDVTLTSRGGKNSAHQNPSVYGVWYELGFVTRNIHAHPFMKPAADGEERAHVERTEQALNAAIGEIG